MTWKNILVHIDGTPRSATRLEIAVALAKQNQARLTGIFGQLAEASRVGTVVVWPPQEYVDAVNAAKSAFDAATAGMAGVRWQDCNRGGAAEVGAQVAHHARFADLVIMGQHDARHAATSAEHLVEDVVRQGGRPVLVIPYIGDFASFGRRPLIAWDNSAGSARAAHDVLPLLAGSELVRIISITHQAGGNDDAQLAADEVAANLAARGLASRSEVFNTTENEQLPVTDLLLNRISDHSVDLLVAGGDAPTGLFASRRDSDARHLLAHMTVPVFISN